MKPKEVVFNPWIGKNYDTSKFNRLMLLGESGYTEEEKLITTPDENLFTYVISKCIEKKFHVNAYKKLSKILTSDKADPLQVFNDIAFANLIQRLMITAPEQPNLEDIKPITKSFWFYLQEVKPNKIIICSQRAWDSWLNICGIDDDIRSKSRPGEDLNEGGRRSTIWEFKYSDTNSCLAIGINHPSSRGFYPNEWVPLVNKFLSL